MKIIIFHYFSAGEAVLGPENHCIPPPIEQLVSRQRLRPGSGFLSVRITTDGPTRVLQILDIKERVSISDFEAINICYFLPFT